MPQGHPLARKEAITLDDLAGEHLLCACSEAGPPHFSASAKTLQEAGVPYANDSFVADEDSIMVMVEAGVGLFPSTDWYKNTLQEQVECVPLDIDVESMQIGLLWKDQEVDSMAEDLAAIISDIFSHE